MERPSLYVRVARLGAALVAAVALILTLATCSTKPVDKIAIDILVLPKFELGELSGDMPGELQYYYEEYVEDGDVYEIEGVSEQSKLYVKGGIAVYLAGMCKVDSALNTALLLSDERFDFSDTYVISTGCAGAAAEYGVPGDVYVLSAAVDYDLGHHADPRDMETESEVTWFHSSDYDEYAVVKLNPVLTNRVYELVKDVKLETTEQTRRAMAESFPGESWADRDPQVLRGTGVTGDNFWKGRYDHANALKIVETFDCEDPFSDADMEDVAILQTLQRFDMIDRTIVIRSGVNLDIFMNGATPESLWDTSFSERAESDDDKEMFDIFPVSMENNFKVGKVIIEAIRKGDL